MPPGVVVLPCAAAIGWAATVAWLIGRAARQFRAYRELEVEPPQIDATLPPVAVVIPARNEAHAIGRCIAALATQDYPAQAVEVVIVDDNSSDDTVIAASAVAAKYRRRFRVMAAGPLPAGWTGKSHACWRGATDTEGEWLCFLDADTVPAPSLLRSAVLAARRERLDFLSLEPRQELGTPWERLVIPAGLFALAFALDHRRTNDPADPAAAANGQFILVRRATYAAAGGHASVCGSIAEDSALAQAVKCRGFRIMLIGGAALIRTRMYGDFASLWEGLSKNCVATFGGRTIMLIVSTAGPLLAWSAAAVPLVLGVLAVQRPSPLLLGAFTIALLASTATVGLHVAGARHLGIPAAYGLLFPVAYTLAAAIGISGVMQQHRGRTRWKGRIYTRAG
jgi:chlorobactene glucosyltransferase